MKFMQVGRCVYNLDNIAIIEGNFVDQGAEVVLHFIHTIGGDKAQTTLRGAEAREWIDSFNAQAGIAFGPIDIDQLCKN
jgi:hypothetical protein